MMPHSAALASNRACCIAGRLSLVGCAGLLGPLPGIDLPCRRSRACTCRPISVALLGKIMCYAIAARWRWTWSGAITGILSLGHGAVLRARRLRHGHVPDAPDRHARRVRQCRSCPTSWCS
jgi:hypothetical protein